MRGTLGVIVKGYPRVSETFITQELLSLQAAGFNLHVFSLRQQTNTFSHSMHAKAKFPVTYLPEYLHKTPLRLIKALLYARSLPAFSRVFQAWWQDFKQYPTREKLRRFGQALVLVHDVPASVTHLYVHFLHTPASVTYYASQILELPWSFSAHAKDIWTTPKAELAKKIDQAKWGTCCSEDAYHYLTTITNQPEKLHLIYHGLTAPYLPPQPKKEAPNGKQKLILAVGRLVAKKGFDILISALQIVNPEHKWHCVIIGDGDSKNALLRQVKDLGLSHKVSFLGARNQHVIQAYYQLADVLVLPTRILENNDRDGIANVLVEAMAMGVCCIASETKSIQELITHKETGLLIAPEDTIALAKAIEYVLSHQDAAKKIGLNAQTHIETYFYHNTLVKALFPLFETV